MSAIRMPDERGDFGKYDEVSERVLKELEAGGVVLVVFGGKEGSGFSVTTCDPGLSAKLPDILEFIARDIRKANQSAKRN